MQHCYQLFKLLSQRLIWEVSLLVICEFLGLFVNTLTADDKYSLRNRQNLRQPIQMQLSKKQNFFSQFSAAFLKLRPNFKHFLKNGDLDGLCISETTDWKRH